MQPRLRLVCAKLMDSLLARLKEITLEHLDSKILEVVVVDVVDITGAKDEDSEDADLHEDQDLLLNQVDVQTVGDLADPIVLVVGHAAHPIIIPHPAPGV